MDLEFIHGQMEGNMLESGLIAKGMGKERL
jgi:hypothetical protein